MIVCKIDGWPMPCLTWLVYRLGDSSLELEAVKDVPYRLTYQNLFEASVFNNYTNSVLFALYIAFTHFQNTALLVQSQQKINNK